MAEVAGVLQQVVGGYIEAIYPYDDPIAIVCHEEGKLIGLPLNRKLEDYDIIAGTFIVCGLGEEDFDSLTPELAQKYREKFADPEIFMKMGSRIVAIAGGLEKAQAIRAVLPALGNEFIVLLKDTSLITVIGGKELLYAAQGIMNRTYEAMFPLLGVAVVYLVLVMLFTWLLSKFERRMAQGDR